MEAGNRTGAARRSVPGAKPSARRPLRRGKDAGGLGGWICRCPRCPWCIVAFMWLWKTQRPVAGSPQAGSIPENHVRKTHFSTNILTQCVDHRKMGLVDRKERRGIFSGTARLSSQLKIKCHPHAGTGPPTVMSESMGFYPRRNDVWGLQNPPKFFNSLLVVAPHTKTEQNRHEHRSNDPGLQT